MNLVKQNHMDFHSRLDYFQFFFSTWDFLLFTSCQKRAIPMFEVKMAGTSLLAPLRFVSLMLNVIVTSELLVVTSDNDLACGSNHNVSQ